MLTDTTAYGQPSLAVALERGSAERRHDTLMKILDIPPERRDARVWAALTRELVRALAIYHRLHDETLPRPKPSTTMSNAYYVDLVEAVSQSRDTAVIPLLIDASGTGVGGELARFGDLAVPGLVATVRGAADDLGQRSGAMFALAALCQPQIPNAVASLSAAGRQQILDVADEIWHSRSYWPHVFPAPHLIPMTVLALATRDSALRARIERLATQSDEWADLSLTDPTEIAQRQPFLRLELSRVPRE
jgi:hypothetical protein